MALVRLPNPGSAYSNAVAVDGPGTTVYISGKIAPGENLRAQAEAIFDQIEADLDAVGGSLGDVVRLRAYFLDFDEYAEYSSVRRQRFGDALPASTAVCVSGLLESALLEIDAIAFIPQTHD